MTSFVIKRKQNKLCDSDVIDSVHLIRAVWCSVNYLSDKRRRLFDNIQSRNILRGYSGGY